MLFKRKEINLIPDDKAEQIASNLYAFIDGNLKKKCEKNDTDWEFEEFTGLRPANHYKTEGSYALNITSEFTEEMRSEDPKYPYDNGYMYHTKELWVLDPNKPLSARVKTSVLNTVNCESVRKVMEILKTRFEQEGKHFIYEIKYSKARKKDILRFYAYILLEDYLKSLDPDSLPSDL